MSKLANAVIELPCRDGHHRSIDGAIPTSNGDSRGAIWAVILGRRCLPEALADKISAEYVRQGIGKCCGRKTQLLRTAWLRWT